jgi:hypothetical protein
MKTLTVEVSTPTTVKQISGNIRRIAEGKQRLEAGLARVLDVIANRDALVEKMDQDGVPGSVEPFNTALLALMDEANFVVLMAEGLRSHARTLLGKDAKDWK